MPFFPGLGGDTGIWQMLFSLIFFLGFLLFFPYIMLFQIRYKLKKSVNMLAENARVTENIFLKGISSRPTEEMRESLDPMKNMVFSPPTNLDPAGIVDKLEHVLDVSDDRMERFVENLSEEELEDEKRANMTMSFKGVYGTQQIYVLVRHFKQLIEDTKNYQLGGMLQMMLPLYEEIAKSQRAATEAFVNEVPIGDSVGPLVAAKFMSGEAEEAAEDVVYSEEEYADRSLYVLKSGGPGSRLGKYGDAIEDIIEEKGIEKLIFVDAGMRFEGEETGKVVEGTGVLMGGPGVEKFKIEEVASEHDVPLEGFIVKQSGPQASRPMHSKIYQAVPEAVDRVKEEVENSEEDSILLVGVGNTVGVGNSRESTSGIPNKLKSYWEEEEEESTSYFGLMKAFPMGGDFLSKSGVSNSFELFQSLVR